MAGKAEYSIDMEVPRTIEELNKVMVTGSCHGGDGAFSCDATSHPLPSRDLDFTAPNGTVTFEDVDAERVVACFLELVAIEGFRAILEKYKIHVEASR